MNNEPSGFKKTIVLGLALTATAYLSYNIAKSPTEPAAIAHGAAHFGQTFDEMYDAGGDVLAHPSRLPVEFGVWWHGVQKAK